MSSNVTFGRRDFLSSGRRRVLSLASAFASGSLGQSTNVIGRWTSKGLCHQRMYMITDVKIKSQGCELQLSERQTSRGAGDTLHDQPSTLGNREELSEKIGLDRSRMSSSFTTGNRRPTGRPDVTKDMSISTRRRSNFHAKFVSGLDCPYQICNDPFGQRLPRSWGRKWNNSSSDSLIFRDVLFEFWPLISLGGGMARTKPPMQA
jgi:hypothetical protein